MLNPHQQLLLSRHEKQIVGVMVSDVLKCLHEMRQANKRGAGIPRHVVRNRQLVLWALRRLRENPRYIREILLDDSSSWMAMYQLPGWEENYVKFVMIHEEPQGRA